MGRVALLEGERIDAGRTALAQIILDREIGGLHGDRFVLRDQSASRTVGGGIVLDPFPPARGRRSAGRLALLREWADADADGGLRAALEHSPFGVDATRYAQAWNVSAVEMEELVKRSRAHLLGPPHSSLAVSPAARTTFLDRILDALQAEHARAPDMVGVSRERLRRLALPSLGQAPFDELIADLLAEGRIQQSGAWLHAPDHRATLSRDEQELWAEVCVLLEQAPFQPPRVRDVALTMSIDEADMRRLLKRVARIGGVYPVAHDHYFTHGAVAELSRIVRELAAEHAFASAARFRDRIGTGRRLAIQILEFFDRTGFTRRVGDSHVLRQPALFTQDKVDGGSR
jgi:selenocysteine-specific elongation factor